MSDFDHGFPDILSNLSDLGSISKEKFVERFKLMNLDNSSTYKIIVAVDNSSKQIIASGTVFFELKFIRNLGTCAHIEDIVVDSKFNGLNLGRHL